MAHILFWSAERGKWQRQNTHNNNDNQIIIRGIYILWEFQLLLAKIVLNGGELTKLTFYDDIFSCALLLSCEWLYQRKKN